MPTLQTAASCPSSFKMAVASPFSEMSQTIAVLSQLPVISVLLMRPFEIEQTVEVCPVSTVNGMQLPVL